MIYKETLFNFAQTKFDIAQSCFDLWISFCQTYK